MLEVRCIGDPSRAGKLEACLGRGFPEAFAPSPSGLAGDFVRRDQEGDDPRPGSMLIAEAMEYLRQLTEVAATEAAPLRRAGIRVSTIAGLRERQEDPTPCIGPGADHALPIAREQAGTRQHDGLLLLSCRHLALLSK